MGKQIRRAKSGACTRQVDSGQFFSSSFLLQPHHEVYYINTEFLPASTGVVGGGTEP